MQEQMGQMRWGNHVFFFQVRDTLLFDVITIGMRELLNV